MLSVIERSQMSPFHSLEAESHRGFRPRSAAWQACCSTALAALRAFTDGGVVCEAMVSIESDLSWLRDL
jgi:hypothetical protein